MILTSQQLEHIAKVAHQSRVDTQLLLIAYRQLDERLAYLQQLEAIAAVAEDLLKVCKAELEGSYTATFLATHIKELRKEQARARADRRGEADEQPSKLAEQHRILSADAIIPA